MNGAARMQLQSLRAVTVGIDIGQRHDPSAIVVAELFDERTGRYFEHNIRPVLEGGYSFDKVPEVQITYYVRHLWRNPVAVRGDHSSRYLRSDLDHLRLRFKRQPHHPKGQPGQRGLRLRRAQPHVQADPAVAFGGRRILKSARHVIHNDIRQRECVARPGPAFMDTYLGRPGTRYN
jgi:hypothetical protein